METLKICTVADVTKRATSSEIIAGYLAMVDAGKIIWREAANSIICALDDQNKMLALTLLNAQASVSEMIAELKGTRSTAATP